MDKKNPAAFGLLIICIAIPLLAGAIGSIFTMEAIPTWYAALQKPSFTPPAWIFGPVWTSLYLLMGIALFVVVRDGTCTVPVRHAVALFVAQILANTAWSFLFFGLRSPLLGLIDIFLLVVLVAGTMVAFYRVSHTAGWLLVPYLCWVSFATVVNAAVWVMN
ncbi:MAG: tryptophan-rich sensory protein [Methanoregula sp.]|nr:MAG: tryptophan-rich sensory protein [Methanoregula sp.]